MRVAIVSGSGGLVGSAAVEHLVHAGFQVIGLENDMRSQFFGPTASTARVTERLVAQLPEFRSVTADVRDGDRIDGVFEEHKGAIELVVHAAAQPSHDWAASNPHADFGINATGTLNLLEATRRHADSATFVFCSTNKVYGDRPNQLPLVELETRLDLPRDHRFHDGIDTSMSIDRSLHSLFGASKAAADLLVQEYGRYFGMPTCCFRAGCLSGAAHAGAELHGFLSYLMRCAVTGDPYTVFGYGGKQVRDNLHAVDLVAAFMEFHRAPRPAAVYNVGGGRGSCCSVLEAIALCERISGREIRTRFRDEPRRGDHRWWISDMREFTEDYPAWTPAYGLERMLEEIHERNAEQWAAPA